MASNVSHPYYPLGLELPHYKENSLPDVAVTGLTLGSFAVIFWLAWQYTKQDKFGRLLGQWERAALCWWVLCGCIHMVVEGYVSLNSGTFPGSNNFLAQLWKEYAKGDSRYMQADACIIIMESLTAWLEGPGCFLIVWGFLNRHPLRHVLQFGVSIGQFYGTLLYFFTEIFDDFAHGPRFHPYYWWFYVFGLNSPWLVVPPILIYQSWKELTKAQKGLDNVTGFNTGNGKEKIR
ncbi:3-beta-hydroxysteroid-Delta(8),Delta(7)-isomerase-like [Acanthaster planci]|uniref:3-beta-hydroxysteroid-Delta(8), Delta(7)-isomerase-like n=1 Tax=Acanthaster planci TaxID=133434 RepID=A0A8B7XJZ4_ACAPL|nr:3-beta-hydroxysteroid-Delta(8),Delta(7)-isomerase-like [Acanthaster planci]